MVAAVRRVAALFPFSYNSQMKKLVLILLFASPISACGNVAIGPVDHSCHATPWRESGSGCSGGGAGGH
jgi:hypothetical protein